MEDDDLKLLKTIGKWTVGVILVLAIATFVSKKTTEVTHLDDAVQNYEEFQEIFNTCTKIDKDICLTRDIPDDDVSFRQFSKAQTLATQKKNLNKWVEEYNAKSKMFGRSLWKSSSLPYQLSVDDYPCYNKQTK